MDNNIISILDRCHEILPRKAQTILSMPDPVQLCATIVAMEHITTPSYCGKVRYLTKPTTRILRAMPPVHAAWGSGAGAGLPPKTACTV